MERMRDGMRLGCLGFWLNCCLLAGCLGLWLGGFARLGSLARGFARLGSLARLADIWTAPGSLARFTSKKFLRFLISQELFLTRSPSRPIEALFTAQSGLTRELLTPKFHIDPRTSLSGPANKLRDTARSACTLTANTGSGHSSLNFQPQQVLPSFYKNFIAI